MQLLVVILNKEEYLEEVLSLFVELGISGATILDSVGMGRILSHDIPIFAGFRDLIVGNRPYNKTILSVVKDEIVEQTANGLRSICGDFAEPGSGLIFSMPVNKVWGMREAG
jgi:nitrogen regulatory protein P-II 1